MRFSSTSSKKILYVNYHTVEKDKEEETKFIQGEFFYRKDYWNFFNANGEVVYSYTIHYNVYEQRIGSRIPVRNIFTYWFVISTR
jgi:hypothetical protein